MSAEIVNFTEAKVGELAYTWEMVAGDFGDYYFETAGDPVDLWGAEGPYLRKTWVLVDVEQFGGEA